MSYKHAVNVLRLKNGSHHLTFFDKILTGAVTVQVINDKAQEVADQAVPTAEKASDKLNEVAADFAENADQVVDDISAKAQAQAQTIAEEAVPRADKLSEDLLAKAKHVEKNAEPTAQDYAKEISANAKKVELFGFRPSTYLNKSSKHLACVLRCCLRTLHSFL